MGIKRRIRYIFLTCTITIIVVSGCIEPYEVATQSFENLLVIEATITNEFKYHEIKLSRTYRLEDEEPSYEMNANVNIVDDFQNTYNFQEVDSGVYRSLVKFKAELGKSYQLFITKSDGKSYISEKEQISSEEGLDSVYAQITTNVLGKEGISIFVDSYDQNKNSKYYRYEYEETYKIIAPYASGYDAIEITYEPPVYELVSRTEEKRVCYKTTLSNKIIQTQTSSLFEDRVTRFPILFIDERSFKTTYRYSILVKQYVQSLDSYTFYNTLSRFSGSESVFSQIQTGYFSGNIFSTSNEDEKVLGYFELATVSSQRIFFKHHDFFPDNTFPPYFMSCYLVSPRLLNEFGFFAGSSLLDALNSGDWVYYAESGDAAAPLLLVETECGDCSSFASNIKPDYWID